MRGPLVDQRGNGLLLKGQRAACALQYRGKKGISVNGPCTARRTCLSMVLVVTISQRSHPHRVRAIFYKKKRAHLKKTPGVVHFGAQRRASWDRKLELYNAPGRGCGREILLPSEWCPSSVVGNGRVAPLHAKGCVLCHDTIISVIIRLPPRIKKNPTPFVVS